MRQKAIIQKSTVANIDISSVANCGFEQTEENAERVKQTTSKLFKIGQITVISFSISRWTLIVPAQHFLHFRRALKEKFHGRA